MKATAGVCCVGGGLAGSQKYLRPPVVEGCYGALVIEGCYGALVAISEMHFMTLAPNNY